MYENTPEPREAFAKHNELLKQWMKKAEALNVADVRPPYVQRYWLKRSLRAELLALADV